MDLEQYLKVDLHLTGLYAGQNQVSTHQCAHVMCQCDIIGDSMDQLQ